MEENMVMVEEKKGLTTGQKLLIAGGTVAAGVIGFKFGKAWQGVLVDSGLEKMFEVDPTFRDHFWEAMGKTKLALGIND